MLQISGPPESPCRRKSRETEVKQEKKLVFSEIKLFSSYLHFHYFTTVLFTWQTSPFFLLNLVQIMCSLLKYCCHLFLHSSLNTNFSVASFSTFDAGSLSPVMPQPAATQLTLAGILPFFFGSPMTFTYLFSLALFFNWKEGHELSWKSQWSYLLLC